MKKIKKPSVGPKTVTPLQQLWESTPEAYHKYLAGTLPSPSYPRGICDAAHLLRDTAWEEAN